MERVIKAASLCVNKANQDDGMKKAIVDNMATVARNIKTSFSVKLRVSSCSRNWCIGIFNELLFLCIEINEVTFFGLKGQHQIGIANDF